MAATAAAGSRDEIVTSHVDRQGDPTSSTEDPLVRITALSKRFPLGRRYPWEAPRVVHAVDDVTLTIPAGRTLGVVGESGSGKSTLGQIVAGLTAPTTGEVQVAGRDMVRSSGRQRREMRRQLQVIFQDPYASLNPRQSIRTILSRPFQVHTGMREPEITGELRTLLGLVGLGPFERIIDRYPHQFSGGQRQRIVFARAIALRPRFIVADEPVSAVDMSVKAQLLTLLRRFQTELGLTYLFITHELSVVRTVAQDVAVMYLGRVVEAASATELFERPLHPYTVALLASTPVLDPVKARTRTRTPLEGTMPSPVAPPPGCHFHTRCPWAQAACRTVRPELRQIGGRAGACHFVGQPGFATTANLSPDLASTARGTALPLSAP
jgi:oligopeptide/dipeptide ABC transporter ATP-binding protein